MTVSHFSLLSIPLLLTTLTSALTHQCDHIRADGVKFDLTKIGGPHSVSSVDQNRSPGIHNTTWTVDICKPLERAKNIDKNLQCKTGTWVCGISKLYNEGQDPDSKDAVVEDVMSIAGNFQTSDGKGLEPHYERLKAKDAKQEGLEIELNGGTYDKRKQKAVINFICDKERTGNEGNEDAAPKSRRRRDEDKDSDEDKNNDEKPDSKNSLSFISYGPEEGSTDTDVLRLDWRTKYACEDSTIEEGGTKGGSWGFFTWVILLLFLGTAAYLIFGSWLNYNRYGARGWDLLPHGDAIRDIPYLFKDWSRKVVDTVSGSGTRGGYSAV